MSGYYAKNTRYWCFQFTGELTDEIVEGLKKLNRRAEIRSSKKRFLNEVGVYLDIFKIKLADDRNISCLDTLALSDWLVVEVNTMEGYQAVYTDAGFKQKFEPSNFNGESNEKIES
jgi:hypothetical protein